MKSAYQQMAEIIPLFKRTAWLQLKRFVESGRVLAPRIEIPRSQKPPSDAADALALLFEKPDYKRT